MRGHDVWRVLEQFRDVSGEVRVPRVRVQDVGVARCAGHREIGRHGEQGSVRADLKQRRVREMREDSWFIAGVAEAVHLDVEEPAQLAGEVLDVHAGAPVDLRGVFAGEQRDSHDRQR